ncbi:hypothetical protein [Photobacterium damselae]|uniref:hypothetical protein n=1 Tax=Photobacterium damselae TaxID=38293 RepID=UPI00406893AA
MKKTIIAASVILSTFSAGSFAATSGAVSGLDTTSATLEWNAKVPTVVAGKWITFTGEAKGTIAKGSLNIEPTGAFTSSPVKVELREYDAATGTVGEGLQTGVAGTLTGGTPKEINYVIEKVGFSSDDATHDLSMIKGQVLETSGNINAATTPNSVISLNTKYKVEKPEGWMTSWAVQNGPGEGINSLTAGEEIKATAIIRADVDFS